MFYLVYMKLYIITLLMIYQLYKVNLHQWISLVTNSDCTKIYIFLNNCSEFKKILVVFINSYEYNNKL